jgi:hypothetical protein
MAHDVFISHAHKDKHIANAICEKLESAQVKCWIAERDISAGEDWTKATRNAIGSSRVMVLVLSENANTAPHIEREIAHAYYTQRTILPVRLSKTPLRRDFLFYLDGVRWFDAPSQPAEQHLEGLIESVNGMVQGRAVTRDGMPSHSSTESRRTLDFSDSWLGALQASHYRSLEILKRVSIAIILFSLMWLLWFLYSQWKEGASQGGDILGTASSVPAASPDSIHKPSGDPSPAKPAYTYTRLGLWVAPHGTPANVAQEPSSALPSVAVPSRDSASPSPQPDLDRNISPATERSPTAGSADVKLAQEQTPETAGLPVPISKGATNETVTREPEPEKPAQIKQDQEALSVPNAALTESAQSTLSGGATPSTQSTGSAGLTDTKAQDANHLSAPSEEQSLKDLVRDYIRAVGSDDDSNQERFFASRVNFYGKGLLSRSGVRASLEHYRQEWPVRKWEPRGEPEFPKSLHGNHPELYEVLQPFAWTVANGSQRKRGSATLYVRIRKDDNGELRIIHVEQRHP